MNGRGGRQRNSPRARARPDALAPAAALLCLPAGATDDAEEVLVAVRIDRELVVDALPAWMLGERLLLPVGDLAAILELPVEMAATSGSGIDEIRVGAEPAQLVVELGRRALRLSGSRRPVEADRLLVVDGEAFLDAELLGPPLGVEIHYDPRTAAIRMQETRPSPRTLRLERLARQQSLGRRTVEPRGEPAQRFDARPRTLALPAGDLSIRLEAGEGGTVTGWGALLEGDLLRLDTSLYLSGSGGELADPRWSAGRRDPDGGLLGVLGAREALIGDVHLSRSGLALVPGSGRGVWVSNRRLDLPTGFSEHVFRGSLPPGWQVELYRSGELIGFTSGDGDGRFELEPVQLLYGVNDFRLVYYGPNGERREETRTLEIGRSQLHAGELEYRAGWVRPDDSEAGAMLDLDYGLSDRFTLSGGILSIGGGDSRRTVAETAITGWLPGMLARVDLATDDTGDAAGRLSLTGRWRGLALRFEHSELDGFTVGGPTSPALERKTRFRLDGTSTFLRLAVPYSLELRREERTASGSVSELAARASLVRRRTSLGHRLAWRRTADSGGSVDEGLGQIQLSRFGKRLALRGEIEYGWAPAVELRSLGIATELRLPGSRLLVTRATRETRKGAGSLEAEVRQLEGAWGWGVGLGYRENEGVRATVSINVGVVPPADDEGEWHTDARQVTSVGSIDARLFLDLDDDGVRDPEEPPVEAVSLMVARTRRSIASDAEGRVRLGRLPCYQPLRVSVDERTLGDPLWVAAVPELEVVLRPGAPLPLEIPIRVLNELSGTLSVRRGDSLREASGVRLQLIDESGGVRRETRVAFDGYFEFRSVEPGRYALRLDPAEAARLGVDQVLLRELSLPYGGNVLDNLDHVVEARPFAPETRVATTTSPDADASISR